MEVQLHIDWWNLSPGEWEGLDPRNVHFHWWIGCFDGLYVLELCSPTLEDTGVVFAQANSLPECQLIAESHSNLIASHLVDPVRSRYIMELPPVDD